jgi:hypothetical protein
MLSSFDASIGAHNNRQLSSKGWNDSWKTFILGESVMDFLDAQQYTNQWSRQQSINAFQNGTIGNRVLEAYTNPVKFMQNASVGAGLYVGALKNAATKGGNS